ncbi:MAG: hypothetical protein HUJ66_00405 [Oscillospiraceae bacterium]|nr:hypothetical protein [Oscillospiraceae bacterium]
MKSKTSFFNPGLIKSNLRRFWPLFAAYALVLLLTLPIYTTIPGNSVINTIHGHIQTASVFITFFMAIAMAMAVYGFMYNQRSCGLISSLPLKRSTVFASAVFSGVIPVFAINLLTALAVFIPLLVGGGTAFEIESVCIWLAVTSMQYLTFFGIATVVAVITGNIVALPVMYIIFNFLSSGIEEILRGIFSEFIFGYTVHRNVYKGTFLSPAVYLLDRSELHVQYEYIAYENVITGVSFSNWPMLTGYALAGAALIVISLLLFRRRRMENCGDVIAIPALRPIFKYGVAVCSALLGSVILGIFFSPLSDNSLYPALYAVFLIIGAFIGYFGSDMLMKKSFRVFKGSWPGVIVLSALCAVFIWSCTADFFGIASDLPETEEISCVEVSSDYFFPLELRQEASLQQVLELNRSIIENKQEHLRTLVTDYVPYDDFSAHSITITYNLKNGSSTSRLYSISNESKDYRLYREVLTCDESYDYYLSFGNGIMPEDIDFFWINYYDSSEDCFTGLEIDKALAGDFWSNAFAPDFLNGSYTGNNFSETPCTLEIELRSASNRDYICITINPDCENMISWLEDNLGISPFKLSETKM